jgi:hypothetical protein
MTPAPSVNVNSNDSSNDSPTIQVMLRCDVCGHLVPEQNMEIHRVQPRACRGGPNSRPNGGAQHPDLASLPASAVAAASPAAAVQTQTQTQPQHRAHQPARPAVETSSAAARPNAHANANLFGATAPPFDTSPSEELSGDDDDDDWFQFQSQSQSSRLESNPNRNHHHHHHHHHSIHTTPTAIASPVHPTNNDSTLTSNSTSTAPNMNTNMEWGSTRSREEPETFLPTGQPVSAAAAVRRRGVPMNVDADDDDDDDERKRVAVARRESGGSVLQVGDVVDLVNSSGSRGRGGSSSAAAAAVRDDGMEVEVEIIEDADVDAEAEQHWPCPRCTLHNPNTSSVCEACNYSRQSAGAAGIAAATGSTSSSSSSHPTNAYASANGAVRAADPVRRDRLVDDPFAEQQQQQQQPEQQQPASYMTSGALLGGVLGVAGAYLRGRPLGSAALHGAMNGAIGGAVLQEFVPPPPPLPRTTPPRGDTRQWGWDSSSTSAAATATAATPDFASPQQVRVVRNRDRNGRMTTTVYTSSSPLGGRRDNRNGRQVAGAGQEDPMLAYIMQAMANSPGGRFDMMGNGGAMAMGMGGQDLDGMSYEQLLQRFGDGSENRGADEGIIQSLPSAAVHDPDKLPEDCRTCCICLEAFEAGGMRKTLPCLHGFHQTCIDKWLRTNAACPICKHHIGT